MGEESDFEVKHVEKRTRFQHLGKDNSLQLQICIRIFLSTSFNLFLCFQHKIIIFPWSRGWNRHYWTWGTCFYRQTREIQGNNVKKLKLKDFKKFKNFSICSFFFLFSFKKGGTFSTAYRLSPATTAVSCCSSSSSSGSSKDRWGPRRATC